MIAVASSICIVIIMAVVFVSAIVIAVYIGLGCCGTCYSSCKSKNIFIESEKVLFKIFGWEYPIFYHT